MSGAQKLPVMEVFGEAFKFSFQRYPTIFRVGLTSLVIVTALVLGVFYLAIPELFLPRVPDVNGAPVDPINLDSRVFIAVATLFPAIALFYGMIIAPLSRLIVLNERPPLISINRSLWMFLLSWFILGLILMAFFFAVSIPLMIAALAFTSGVPGDLAAVQVVLVLLIYVFLYYVIARLVLFQTDAIVEGNIGVRRSWAMTRSNVLRLVGLWILAAITSELVLAAMQAIYLPLMIASVDNVPAAIPPDPTLSPVSQFIQGVKGSPIYLVSMLVFLIVQFWMIGFMYSLPAFAYKALKRGSRDDESVPPERKENLAGDE